MGKQETEMLKGTLEGIVLAMLAGRRRTATRSPPSCATEGFTDIAEGTVYALLVRVEQRGLVDVEKVPSEKGPPRKVYTLNDKGRAQLDEFWRTWSFLQTVSNSSAREAADDGREVDRGPDRVARAEEAVQAGQGPDGVAARAVPQRRHGVHALLHVLRGLRPAATPGHDAR